MITKELVTLPFEDIKPYSKNPRVITQAAIDKVIASIVNYGYICNIAVDEKNVILAGHTRLIALGMINDDDIEVTRITGLNTAQKKAFRIMDNKSSEFSDWDDVTLVAELMELDDIGDLMHELDTGFLADELALLMGKTDLEEETTGDDDAPEVNTKEAESKLGEIYELGPHLLMCGDSTSKEDVERLMDGQKADMVFTDPPYGINHSGKGIDGATSGEDFGEIIGDSDISVAVNALSYCVNNYPDSAMVFWGANYYCSSVPNGFGWLVWDKQREGDTFSGAELAYVNKGIRLDVFRHQWHGMIKASEHGQKRVHPTQKPIALAEWCFTSYGEKNQTVLDLFGGSGSTLIACAKTDRVCRMMELSPHYCDVIRKRWSKWAHENNREVGSGALLGKAEA